MAPQALVFERGTADAGELAEGYETARVGLATALQDAQRARMNAELGLIEARGLALAAERKRVESDAATAAAQAALTAALEHPAAPPELYTTSRLRRAWLTRRGHINHGRILVRRTREVFHEHGPFEVLRRARDWTNERVEELQEEITIQGVGSAAIEGRYGRWRTRHEPNDDDLARQRETVETLAYRPLVSVVVPVFDPPRDVLREALESALRQTYNRIELCIANAGDSPECAAYLDALAPAPTSASRLVASQGKSRHQRQLQRGARARDRRVRGAARPRRPARAVGALRHGRTTQRRSRPRLLYSDEDRLQPFGRRILPYLKPEWSPEFVHSYHWPGHLSVYRRSLSSRWAASEASTTAHRTTT